MKLVQLLFKKFIPVLVVSMLFFVLLLSLADIFVNIWSYMSHAVPVATVLRITAYFIPKAVWYAVPIAMLFASAYVLSDFYAKNELLAVFASGVSVSMPSGSSISTGWEYPRFMTRVLPFFSAL